MLWLALAVAVLLMVSLMPSAHAFDPPVETVGPLTARIEGPNEVAQVGQPFPVKVWLENRGEKALQGTARLQGIDGWRIEPDQPVAFALAAQETKGLDFRVTPHPGAYNAHYPLHAFVEFDGEGQRQRAHPILILQVRRPDPPRPSIPVLWEPFPVASDQSLALWRLPMRRAVLRVFGREAQVMPVGWQGSEERTRANVQFTTRVRRGEERECLSMHPPWFAGQAGTILAEFPLRLPQARPIRLRFGLAIRDHDPERGEPPSDGVTFRVRALPFDAPAGQEGEVLFERHTDAKVWQEGEADLGRFAGQAIRLQLECHPGPKGDTTCDQAFWAEPTLIAGTPPTPPSFPPAPDAPGRSLGTLEVGGQRYEVRLWLGQRGLLDAAVGFLQGGKRLLFRGFPVRVLGEGLEEARSPSLLEEVKEEKQEGRYRVRHRFRSWAGPFEVVGELALEGGALRARFWMENPPPPRPWLVVYLEDVAAGPWSERAVRVYAGPGNVLQEPEAFTLGFDGHRLSTSFVGFDFANGFSLMQGVDVPPSHLEVEPKGRRYTLHTPHAQTLTFIPAPNVWEAVKVWRQVNSLKPAGGVGKLAGRFVFDLWGGRYGESAQALRRAFRYGLTDAVVVWHNWQRWGYDYRLPDIYPPNPRMGTFEEFLELVRACKEHGVLFAPHDNYIDFYPDAEGYSYEHIAFTREGQPVRAWFNEGRQAQSYRWRADRLWPFMERNLRLIRQGFAPTAYFIDVWSSAGPYDYWTHDGRFYDRIFTRNTWGQVFAWIREFLGDEAPQISESGHDQLIGWLDGAQTNHLRVDVPPEGYYRWAVWNIRCVDAERIPWFDAAHHDRFVLHGAGYESRYAAGLSPRLHGIYSDDYIATEVLTGHPAMVSRPFGRDVVRKYWLLHDLMRALALRRIEEVEFVGDNLHRQHVRWDNGGLVWVNRGSEDWEVEGHRLPQYGFYARVPTAEGLVEAAIERREGVIVEWSRSPRQLYVNARPVVSDRWPVQVRVEEMRFLGKRRFLLRLAWEAKKPLPTPMRVFVHFTNAAGEIQFQGDHDPPLPTTQWQGTVPSSVQVEVPAKFSPGQTFELRVGLYDPKGGVRAPLEGRDDGTQRIRLGTLRLEGKGEEWTGIAWNPLPLEPDPMLQRLNPDAKIIAFGPVRTNGACRLRPEEGGLGVVPLPDGPGFTVFLRWRELPWDLPQPRQVEALDEEGKVLQRLPLEREGEEVVLRCEPGVFAYRLR